MRIACGETPTKREPAWYQLCGAMIDRDTDRDRYHQSYAHDDYNNDDDDAYACG